MSDLVLIYTQAIVTFFLVIDPPGLIPVFLAITKGMTEKERLSLLNKSIVVGFVLLIIFTIFGSTILWLFGIDVHDFRVAGGFLLLIVSLQIVFTNQEKDLSNSKPGVVPFATPLMVGPGVVTATIVLSGTVGIFKTLIAGAVAFLLAYLVLYFGKKLFSILGKDITDVITKVIGLILAAISVRYIREGFIGIMQNFG
ncbi:MarC family protein [Deferribacterales bacterium Es71-Z0220]|uniref:MarC family protein n=1 Tax=Deferrivibrio essentukiensis TaxID=2880922 RepID=UPI001F60F39F|nr:MarC family protein [Deferrivibrio essentukiensis]MBZ4671888.1 multiple antibiotic transporter, MarC family [Deferribacteraceae bacterium]MCB4203807.1 MarC family protein [Deferrivibrio essentukiensis]